MYPNCFSTTPTLPYVQSAGVYEEGITRLSLNCARAAARHGVTAYVEVGDGRLSASAKVSKGKVKRGGEVVSDDRREEGRRAEWLLWS